MCNIGQELGVQGDGVVALTAILSFASRYLSPFDVL
jgi:hypothetical protein